MTLAWLAALNSNDLGCFIGGYEFIATQTTDEELRQEVRWVGGFGRIGPVARNKRPSEENTLSFSAVLLRDPPPADNKTKVLNGINILKNMSDFEMVLDVGDAHAVYPGVNWSRIHRAASIEQVLVTCDMVVPGYVAPTFG